MLARTNQLSVSDREKKSDCVIGAYCCRCVFGKFRSFDAKLGIFNFLFFDFFSFFFLTCVFCFGSSQDMQGSMLGSKVRLDLLWANRLLLAEMLVFGVGMHVQVTDRGDRTVFLSRV